MIRLFLRLIWAVASACAAAAALLTAIAADSLADERVACEAISSFSDDAVVNDALAYCDVARVTCNGETYYLDKSAEAAPISTVDVVDGDGNPVKICSKAAPSHPIEARIEHNLLRAANVTAANAVRRFADHVDEINKSLRETGLEDGYSSKACAFMIPGPGPDALKINQCVRRGVCDGDSPTCGAFCYCQNGIGNIGIALRERPVPDSGVCPADGKSVVDRNTASARLKTYSLKITGDTRKLEFTKAELAALEIKPLGPGSPFACYYGCRQTSRYFLQRDDKGTLCMADVAGCTAVTFKHGQPISPVRVDDDGTHTAACMRKGFDEPSKACPKDIDVCMNNAQFWISAPDRRNRLRDYGHCMIQSQDYDACIKAYNSGQKAAQ